MIIFFPTEKQTAFFTLRKCQLSSHAGGYVRKRKRFLGTNDSF